MNRSILVAATTAVVIGMAISACGSSSGSPGLDDRVMTKPGALDDASVSRGPSGGDAAPATCAGDAGNLVGCGCTPNAAPRPCFTVEPARHGHDGCADGTQTCGRSGELYAWSACAGEVTTCANTVADAGTDAASLNCICYAGAIRWCDTPVSCQWGKQQCMPDGTWGTCNETPDRPQGVDDDTFDWATCANSGECCEQYGDPTKSHGNCVAIACPGSIIK